MCRLIETIAIVDGEFRDIEYHNQRFNQSRALLYGETNELNLAELIDIKNFIPEQDLEVKKNTNIRKPPFNLIQSAGYPSPYSFVFPPSIFKCRIVYGKTKDRTPIYDVSVQPYQRRKVKRLKIVEAENIDYSLKYEDRSILDQLYSQRGNTDDILIVQNGLFADGLIYNLVFQKEEELFTPERPLLYGTKRQKLLDQKLIQTAKVHVNDLKMFDGIWLINAMNGLGEIPMIPVKSVLE